MTLSAMHPQDVLAKIRKACGSAAAFERKHNLPAKSVHDVLRGRVSARVQHAIEILLAEQSDISASSRNVEQAHRIKPVNAAKNPANGSAAA